MCTFSNDTKARLGNALIYIAERTNEPSKTKALKLLYMMEEMMVLKYHAPFLGLPFKVWTNGPVQMDTYIELSGDNTFLLKDYIDIVAHHGPNRKAWTSIKPKVAFDAEEFSDAELSVMNEVIRIYGNKTAGELIKILHRKDSLWSITAERHHLKAQFDAKTTNSSDVKLDLSELLQDERWKELYNETLAIRTFANESRASVNV